MKKHRTFLISITAALIFAMLCSMTASAANSDILRASPTLSSYSAILTQGSSTGEIKINYDVCANSKADSLGVSSIKIYKSNGSYVTTITPTALNGLSITNSGWHLSSYTYTGVSGTSYYAVVTVFATIDGVSDSREITTNTVKAP